MLNLDDHLDASGAFGSKPLFQGAADDALRFMVREQVERGSPARFEWPQLPPVVRRWKPAFDRAAQRARIVAARAELGLEAVRKLKAPTINKSAREGWRGRTYSFKSGGIIHWNGRLVEAAILEADADANVTQVVSSPMTVEYQAPSGWRTKSPDLLIVRNGEPWLIECTWEHTAARPGQAERWRSIGEGCASIGLGFEVLTELHLERRPRAKNVAAIGRARCDEPSDVEVRREVTSLIEREGASVDDCVSRLRINRRAVYRMILEGFVAAELDGQLDKLPLALGPKAAS